MVYRGGNADFCFRNDLPSFGRNQAGGKDIHADSPRRQFHCEMSGRELRARPSMLRLESNTVRHAELRSS